MPKFSGVYPYLSYVTADGAEIVLSSADNNKWWECYGREGFGAFELNHITKQYSDGATDTTAMIPKPRKMVIRMVARGETTAERDEFLRDLISGLVQIGSRTNWGKLKLMRSDGKMIAIDCVYTGGLDEITANYPTIQQFDLEFFSGNGYFYEVNNTSNTLPTGI